MRPNWGESVGGWSCPWVTGVKDAPTNGTVFLCHSFCISSPLDFYSEKCDSLYFSALPHKNTPSSLCSNMKIFGGELWHSSVRYPLLTLILWPVMWEAMIGPVSIKCPALDQSLCLGRWDLKYCFQNKAQVLLWPVGLTHQLFCQIFNCVPIPATQVPLAFLD